MSKMFLSNALFLTCLVPQAVFAGDFLDQLFSGDDCIFASDQTLLSDWQNQPACEDWTYSVGGALRYRYLDERNRLRPPLRTGRSDYDQWRFTPYVQMDYQKAVSFYVQAIDASTFNSDLPEVFIDENRSDLLQYYIDANLMEIGDGELHFKYGRQMLLYGSQHLISPLAWANTFRNFEGSKLYYKGSNWDIDAFAVQPVNGASLNAFHPRSYDTPDQSRWFSGVYATYKQAPGGVMDFYWLWLKEDEDVLNLIDGNRHTIGTRYAGKRSMYDDTMVWNWDLEGGYQFGNEDFLSALDEDIQAGYFSAMVGPTFTQLPWSPALTGIFWWGSGDTDPLDGTRNTNNTLFPLGHAYWGQIDNFNGQNLLDYALQLVVNPADKWSLYSAYHYFDKASRNDAIYNVAGVPFGGLNRTDKFLGTELDLVLTYQVGPNLQLQWGYYWFWYGDAITNNPNPLLSNRKDSEQFYFLADWAF